MKKVESEKVSTTSDASPDKENNTARRKALKAAIGGSAMITAGAVPAKWAKPIINSAILPAHAVTSEVAAEVNVNYFGPVPIETFTNIFSSPRTTGAQYALINNSEKTAASIVNNIADLLIAPAQAQGAPGLDLCVEDMNGTLSVTLQSFSDGGGNGGGGGGNVVWRGTGALDVPITISSACGPPVFDLEAVISQGAPGTLDYIIQSSVKKIRPLSGSIPEGNCSLSTEVCPVVLEE